MRILHFDPWFANIEEFLDSYFTEWNLVKMEIHGGMSWVNDHMEVIVIPQSIDHKEHFWFFESLVESILQTKGRLVVQEYTGYEVMDLNMKLLELAPNKELYKRRVLFDMTYGTDTGCCTDMTKAQPFYDYDGNFLNLHFMNDQDARRWIGISTKVDEILKKKYVAKFLQTLNYIHVDYRRKMKGDSLLYGSSEYSNDSTPDEIMTVLQQKLSVTLEILQLLRVVPNETSPKCKELFETYKTQDPYKWYDCVRKLLPPP